MNISLVVTVVSSPNVDDAISEMGLDHRVPKSKIISEIVGIFLREIGYDDPEDIEVRPPANNLVISSENFNRALIFRVNNEIAGSAFVSESSILMYLLSDEEANVVERALYECSTSDLGWVKFNFTESYRRKKEAYGQQGIL